MCDLCADHAQPPVDAGQRRRMWEIRGGFHCSICGTCLSLAELRKIAAKAGLRLRAGATEYEVHGYFVQAAAEPQRVTRLMHKLLDKKYRIAIDTARRLTSDAELREFWAGSLAKGDVPGPYWALMTHPQSTDDLLRRAFGEVHMLSHLVGASNRADIRRLTALAEEKQTLAEDLANAKRRLSEKDAECRHLVDAHASELRAQSGRVQAADAAQQRLAAAEARLDAFERGEAYRTLQAERDGLAAELETATRTGENESRNRAVVERELSDLRRTHDGLTSMLQSMSRECEALESLLQAGIHGADGTAGEPSSALDLCGRRIAYVGGRTGLVGHFRALVEQSNGQFIHHDGGLEESEGRLGGVLGQADVVMCPVDCVSHGACLRAKRFCKRTATTFVQLRSAGLSSFVSGLRQVAANTDAPHQEFADSAR